MIKLYNKLFLVLFYFLFLSSCNFSTDKNSQTIKDAVVVLSKGCPIEIDYMTILDKVEYESPKTIIFYCSANINLVKTDIEALKESIRSNVTYQILNNNNKNIKKLKDAGATFHYIYKTQAGKEFLNITFDPEFYSKHQDTPQDTLTDQELYKLLKEIADLQNTQLPRQLDEYSTLYKINALSPRTLEYIYRAESTINDMDTTYFSSPEARQNILDDFDKTSSADRLLKDNKVIFRFTYEDKDGIYMSSLDITPEEYK